MPMNTDLEPATHAEETAAAPPANTDAAPDVTAILEQIRSVRRKMVWVGTIWAVLHFVFLAGISIYPAKPVPPWLGIATALYLTTLLGISAGLFWNVRRIANLQKQFAGIEDVQYINNVIDAFGNEWSRPDKAIVETLIKLLCRLQASDARFLTTSNRLVLNIILRSDVFLLRNFGISSTASTQSPAYSPRNRLKLEDRIRLVLAVVKAMEQVGDETAIAPVRHLTKSLWKPVREAAQECLPFLYQRANEQRASQGLLRPADNTATPDVLLRPAIETPDPPEQLLRATTNENANGNT